MTQSNSVIKLPRPYGPALAHSDMLLELIKQCIREQGNAIPFDDFMSLVLYEPGLGYYSAGGRKFGKAGDFVTAPEISPIFSRCLANQCLEVLVCLDRPIIMELGAGSGIMAKWILNELQQHNALPEAYWILEVSADLSQRQQALLKQEVPFFYDKIKWLDKLPVTAFNGVILANEVVDALPIKRFIKTTNGFNEAGVGLSGGELVWVDMVASEVLRARLQMLEDLLGRPFPEGYISEINISLQAWLNSVTKALANGVILLLDYGYPRQEYYRHDRNDGTLLCYYKHMAHNGPFFYPGLQDITAAVDFTLLAECADQSKLDVKGYTTQAYFLLGNGLEQYVARLPEQGIRQQVLTAQQIRTLILPGEMGEQIKVMALGRGFNKLLSGFSLMDQRARL